MSNREAEYLASYFYSKRDSGGKVILTAEMQCGIVKDIALMNNVKINQEDAAQVVAEELEERDAESRQYIGV